MLCDLLLFIIIDCVLSVNNHNFSDSPFVSSSLKRSPHLIEGTSSALNPPVSVNSTQTDARSSSYDDVISAPSKVKIAWGSMFILATKHLITEYSLLEYM